MFSGATRRSEVPCTIQCVRDFDVCGSSSRRSTVASRSIVGRCLFCPRRSHVELSTLSAAFAVSLWRVFVLPLPRPPAAPSGLDFPFATGSSLTVLPVRVRHGKVRLGCHLQGCRLSRACRGILGFHDWLQLLWSDAPLVFAACGPVLLSHLPVRSGHHSTYPLNVLKHGLS